MIITMTLKIPFKSDFDNIYIEQEIKRLGFNPIRWAVVDINEEDIILSVSA